MQGLVILSLVMGSLATPLPGVGGNPGRQGGQGGQRDNDAASNGCSFDSNTSDACQEIASHASSRGIHDAVANAGDYVVSDSECEVHCISSNRGEDDAFQQLVSTYGSFCDMPFVGKATVGQCTCVLACAGPVEGDGTPAPQQAPQDPEPVNNQVQQVQQVEQAEEEQVEISAPQGDFEGQCLSLTNAHRASVGLPALSTNVNVSNACIEQANCMASTGIMDHNACASFQSRLAANQLGNRVAAENIAQGHLTPQAVVAEWIASSGHRQNIENPDVTHVGCCISGEFTAQVFVGL